MKASQPTRPALAFGVVILGAGSSQRMGRPKLLLPWAGTSVLGHLIGTWRQLATRQIAIVCAEQAPAIQTELDQLGFPAADRIVNPDPARGMFSSIQCAAAWRGWDGEITHWIVTLGDQPHLRPDTLGALLEFGAAHPRMICQPLRSGRRRHPVLLPRPAFGALGNCSATSLKQFLAARPNELAGFEAADQGLEIDLDTPADYERAWKLYFEGC